MPKTAKSNQTKMTRGEFLRNAGVGAAALGALAIGRSTTANAEHAGALHEFRIGLLNAGGSAGQIAANLDQFNKAISALNEIGSYRPGNASQQMFVFTSDARLVTSANIQSNLDTMLGNIHAVVGALSSSIALSTTGNPIPAYQRILGQGIPYGECRATADSLTSSVDPSTGSVLGGIVPLKMFRTTSTSSNYGEASFASLGDLGFTSVSGVKALCVRDVGNYASYGWAASLKFKQMFEQAGGTVITSGGADPGFAFNMLAGPSRTASSITVAEFEALIRNFLSYGMPDVIFGAWTASTEFLNFHQAWSNVQATGDFPGMENTKFLHVGSLGGVNNAGFTWPAGYEGAKGIIASQRMVMVQPWYDDGSKGYLQWYANYQCTSASCPVIQWDKQLRVFDATLILGLSLMGSFNDGSSVFAKIYDVDNPNEVKVYPGEKLNQLFGLLRQAKAMNYEGASGPCDILQNGDLINPVFRAYTTNPDLSINLLNTFYL